MQANQVQAIQSAVRILGNQAALARALGVTPATVGQWLKPDVRTGREVPPKQCVRIEQLTQGAVTRRDLRPKDWLEYWPELAAAPASIAQAATESVATQGAVHV
jgi:DNA-binding transcriptional regulator YdaS (Cro superfamily)